MAGSFFEKLKKGMGIEGPIEETKETEEKPPKESLRLPTGQAKRKRVRIASRQKASVEPEEKITINQPVLEEEPEPETEPEPKPELEQTPAPEEVEKPAAADSASVATSAKEAALEDKEKWFEAEGELAIDVYQTETDLVIQSAIAGVKPEDLDITLERDILTVRGVRQKPFEETGDYFTQECYWGPFSREVILPVEVDPDRAEASMKDGILTIRIPKILREKKRRIKVRL